MDVTGSTSLPRFLKKWRLQQRLSKYQSFIFLQSSNVFLGVQNKEPVLNSSSGAEDRAMCRVRPLWRSPRSVERPIPSHTTRVQPGTSTTNRCRVVLQNPDTTHGTAGRTADQLGWFWGGRQGRLSWLAVPDVSCLGFGEPSVTGDTARTKDAVVVFVSRGSPGGLGSEQPGHSAKRAARGAVHFSSDTVSIR